METILDAPSARQASYRLSVENYHRLNELGMLRNDVELLDGHLIKKMPKSPLHTFICHWLLEALRRCLPPGMVVRQEQPLTTPTSEPEPDLVVARGSFEDFRERHPASAELVIEVAVSTEEIDLRKAALYAEAGVKEYWVVEPQPKRITVFLSPQGRAYQRSTVFEGAQTVSCASLPGFEVNLMALFAQPQVPG
jgi:Uma2 family endonuclease